MKPHYAALLINRKVKNWGTTLILMLLLMLEVTFSVAAVPSEENARVVRVGWHEVPYFITDQYGRHSGYSYEYQRKVAAYTGWTYEYVEGSWSELLQMLKDGKIDLLSDVSYMEDRTKDMLYSSIPMGTEAYYIFVAPGNKEITSDNLAALNGKKVGVAKGSIQKDKFIQWAGTHGIEVELTELTTAEEESLLLLGTELDAFVSIDIFGNPDTAIPVCKIGSSDFYFAVNRSRPDLLIELDAALNKIQDENMYFDQQLHDKYLRNTEPNRFLSTSEKEWLSDHGTIRVAYQDNYLAFCASEENTGDLTGALKDFLDYASTAFENANPTFETVAFPTASAALEALKNGEVDCMFPANMTAYDAEELGVLMTTPLMRTEMDAVVRASEQKEFLLKKDVTVAVNEGNTNYDIFLADNFPTWKRAYFVNTPAGLDAVAAGEADCVIISNYRYNNISRQCEKLHLSTVYTGVDMDFCLAVKEGDTELYTILTKMVNIIPESAIHTALTYYSTEDVKTSFSDLIKDNLFIVMSVIAAVLFVILLLLLSEIRAERKIREEEHLVRDLNKRVNFDALTSVRNKGAFTDYIQKIQDGLDNGIQKEFGIGVFDCDNLKLVNDRNGHDKGDIYLKLSSRLICSVFQHSPVFRIGGDEFSVVLMNDDFRNREELIQKFEAEQDEICSNSKYDWEKVHIAHGIAVYDPEIDGSVNDTLSRADKNMYENKRNQKDSRRGK